MHYPDLYSLQGHTAKNKTLLEKPHTLLVEMFIVATPLKGNLAKSRKNKSVFLQPSNSLSRETPNVEAYTIIYNSGNKKP